MLWSKIDNINFEINVRLSNIIRILTRLFTNKITSNELTIRTQFVSHDAKCYCYKVCTTMYDIIKFS